MAPSYQKWLIFLVLLYTHFTLDHVTGAYQKHKAAVLLTHGYRYKVNKPMAGAGLSRRAHELANPFSVKRNYEESDEGDRIDYDDRILAKRGATNAEWMKKDYFRSKNKGANLGSAARVNPLWGKK